MTTDQPIPRPPRNVNDRRPAPQPRAPGSAGAGGVEVFPDDGRPTTDAPPPEEAPRKPLVSFTIHALLDDFPIDVAFTGSAEQLRATVGRLRDLGAVPPTPAARAAVEAERQREAPRCEFHGPMTASTKAPGTWYCSKKMGDGSYCKSKA